MNGFTAEWVSAVASVLALLVVAIGSYAALRQIAHLRQGLQVEVVLRLFEQYQTPRVRDATAFARYGLAEAFADPHTREMLRIGVIFPAIETVMPLANFMESMGQLVGTKVVDPALVIDAFPVLELWELLAPTIALLRITHPEALEMFEYLAAIEVDRNAARGTTSSYPAAAKRMVLPPDEPA